MNAVGPTIVLWVAFAALAIWVAWWVRREVRDARTAHRDDAAPPQCLHCAEGIDVDHAMCGTEVTDPMTLVILAATPNAVVFQSTGPETYTATVADLDRARQRIARYGNARIGPHTLDEADVIALHNAIRAAAERGTS